MNVYIERAQHHTRRIDSEWAKFRYILVNIYQERIFWDPGKNVRLFIGGKNWFVGEGRTPVMFGEHRTEKE